MILTNQKSEIQTDESGRLLTVRNLRRDRLFPVRDFGVRAVFNGKECADPACFRTEWTVLGDSFEKAVTFTAPEDGVLESATVFQVTFPDAREEHYHDDKTLWHTPLCVFVRYEGCGVYYGMEYPYWDDEAVMTFSPWLPMKAGETLVLEKAFLGTFENTGRTVSSHGAYPGKRKQRYTDLFSPEKGGLPQHVPDGKIPDDMGIEEEVLDTGEIRAMKNFFADLMGHYPLPEEGFWVWQNGWWAGLFNDCSEAIPVLSRAGVHDVLTAMMYYGYDSHPNCSPNYIRDVTFDPLRFPAMSKEIVDYCIARAVRSQTNRDKANGVEREIKPAAVEWEPGEPTDRFVPPPHYARMMREAEAQGVHFTSFCTPTTGYTSYPQWYTLQEDGTPYPFYERPYSCPACGEYMDRHLQMISSIFESCSPRIWSFDGRWMGYRECPSEGGERGETPCWSADHGHLPGKSRYLEWKRIREFKRKLKERFPSVVLEHYYGVKRGGTWCLEFCNSDENIYECSCSDDNRFQTWHNENDRFRPTYLNYAPIFGLQDDLEYSMISAISTAEYAQIANAYDKLRDDPHSVEVFRKWKAWAGENHRYLQDRDTLFGCPGDVSVDGSSHILDGEGWVFLFNTVDFDDTAELVLSEIPGLEDCRYEARVIYPEERTVPAEDGVIRIPVASHKACVLFLSKCEG